MLFDNVYAHLCRKKLKSSAMVDDSIAEGKESEDTTTTPQTSSSKKRSSFETSNTTPTVDLSGEDAPSKASTSSAKKQVIDILSAILRDFYLIVFYL